MESLQIRKIPGEIYIGCGFIRGKLAGIYYDILGRVGSRLAAGVALCKALGARLPGGGRFSPKKSSKRIFKGQDCNRLRRRGVLQKVFICTPARRGVTFL